MRRKSRTAIPAPKLTLAGQLRGALQTALNDRRYTGAFTSTHILTRWVNPGIRIYSKGSDDVKAAASSIPKSPPFAFASTGSGPQAQGFELKLPIALHDLSPEFLYFFRTPTITRLLEIANPEWKVDVRMALPLAPAISDRSCSRSDS
jgi:hypothetical protein